MAIYGSSTPVSKIVTEGFPVYAGSFLRVLVGFLVLLPFLIKERDTLKSISKKDWMLLGVISVIGVFLFSIFMLEGMKRVSGVVGSIVMSTTPAVTALGAFLFYKESFGIRKILALALAVIGVVIINLSHGMDDGGISTGTLIIGSAMIFGAVLGEVCFTLVGKKVTDNLNPILITGITCVISSLLFLPFALYQMTEIDFSTLDASNIAAVLWWGAGTLALGTVLWYSGIKLSKPGQAAIFMAVMPVSALVLSYVLLGEKFHWIHAVGFGIVLGSIFLATHKNKHQN